MFLAILRIKYQYFFILCHEIFCNRTNANLVFSLLPLVHQTDLPHKSQPQEHVNITKV